MDPLVEYVEHIDVRAATIEDRPGGLAHVLSCGKRAQTCNSSLLGAQNPGKGVVFVTPLRGDREIAAAAQVVLTLRIPSIPFEFIGLDRPGIAAELTQKLADGRAAQAAPYPRHQGDHKER